MTYKFFPHTDDDIRQMLAKIGIGGVLLGELAEHVAHFLLAHGLRKIVFSLIETV